MLVGVLSWRWAFLINVPVALVILLLTLIVVPPSRSREDLRLYVPCATSLTLGLLEPLLRVTDGSLPALVVGMILLALFFGSSAVRKRHWSRLKCWRCHRSDGAICALTIFSMEAGLVFLTTLYLQNVLHFGPLTTGLVLAFPDLPQWPPASSPAELSAAVALSSSFSHR